MADMCLWHSCIDAFDMDPVWSPSGSLAWPAPNRQVWVFQCILTFNDVFSAMFQPFLCFACLSVVLMCSHYSWRCWTCWYAPLPSISLVSTIHTCNVMTMVCTHADDQNGDDDNHLVADGVARVIWIDRSLYLSCIGCWNAAICTECHYRWEWQPPCTKYPLYANRIFPLTSNTSGILHEWASLYTLLSWVC